MEVFGRTYRTLLEHAVIAYFELVTDRARVRSARILRFRVSGGTPEDVLYQLLREVHYRQSAEGWLGRSARVRRVGWSPLAVEVELRGETYRARRHELKDEIKAVTLHRLRVWRSSRSAPPRQWRAFVVFDV
ncbi:MAG: archease [Nitrospirae bacterium]|nr:archease [Nitrospirota bacterium]